jgi:hydrogenase nickel incorporation protein HypA/HybF
MHELAICEALVRQVGAIAEQRQASAVEKIVIAVGPLSGVEPELLARAFTVAQQGTLAQKAELYIEQPPIEVSCRTCGHAGQASANRLLCAACGDWRVKVQSGDDLMLLRLELTEAGVSPSPPPNQSRRPHHV